MRHFYQTTLLGLGVICLLSVLLGTQQSRAAVVHQVPTSQASFHATRYPSGNHSVREARTTGPQLPAVKLSTYKVQPSDTLWEIANISGVSVPTLQRINGIRTTTIYAGESLQVPQKWQTYAKARASSQQSAVRSVVAASTPRDMSDANATVPGVPSQLIPLYKAAGQRYGIPWTVLAAIHKTETNFAVSNCPVSSEGAMGPMQFLPSTFAAYGVTAPGHHGRPNIRDVSDAVYTAAHMLARDNFSSNPAGALYAYNHSTAYVKRIMALSSL